MSLTPRDEVALMLARDHVRPDEQIRWIARPSLVGLVPIVFYTASAIALLVLGSRMGLEDPTSALRGAPALVLAVAGIAIETGRRFVKLRFTTYVVTDQRIYSITSFLETDARSIPLARLTAVTVRQGLFGRILGLWQARISTFGGEGGRGLEVPAIRDGEGLLREASAGLRRGANVSWLRGGD